MTKLCIDLFVKSQIICLIIVFMMASSSNPAAGESNVKANKLLKEADKAALKSDYKKAYLNYKKACEQGNDTACITVKGSKGYVKGSTSYDNVISEYTYYNLAGWRFYYRGNFDDALKLYKLADKISPREINAYHLRSDVYILTKQYENAFKDADRAAISIKPSMGHFLKAKALWHQEDTKNAINEFMKLCRIESGTDCTDISESKLNQEFQIQKPLIIFEESFPKEWKETVFRTANAIYSDNVEYIRVCRSDKDWNAAVALLDYWRSVGRPADLKFKARLWDKGVILSEANKGQGKCNMIFNTKDKTLLFSDCPFDDRGI